MTTDSGIILCILLNKKMKIQLCINTTATLRSIPVNCVYYTDNNKMSNHIVNIYDLKHYDSNDLEDDIQSIYINFINGIVSCQTNGKQCDSFIKYVNDRIQIKLPFIVENNNDNEQTTKYYIRINIYDIEFYHAHLIENDEWIDVFDGMVYVCSPMKNPKLLLFSSLENNGYIQILYCKLKHTLNDYDVSLNDMLDNMSYDLPDFKNMYFFTIIHVLYYTLSKTYFINYNPKRNLNIKNKLLEKIQVPFVHRNENGMLYLECYDNMTSKYYYIIEKIIYCGQTIDFIQKEKCRCKIYKILHTNKKNIFVQRGMKCICFYNKLAKKMESIGFDDVGIMFDRNNFYKYFNVTSACSGLTAVMINI